MAMACDPRVGAVAQRAADLSAASGIHLPDELLLWSLAGGRPPASDDPVGGQPDELGAILEAGLDVTSRRTLGAHYTPASLAGGLVARALAGHQRPSVGDPACGGGALLLAAARHLAAGGEDERAIVDRLWGADVDPVAVATTEAALALWAGACPPPGRLTVADALADPLPWPALDVVVGNPPFLSQLGHRTTRSAERSAHLRARFGAAVRPYTDTAGLFLLLGCELARPGGTVAMLQPQSVLGARDAAGVRTRLAAHARLRELWVPEGGGFDAAVDVCAPILEVGVPAGPGESGRWSAELAHATGVPVVRLDAAGTVGDEVTTAAAFRDEYYGLVAALHEQADCPHGVPLVTTGLVDLGRSAWGERPARLARRRWDAPVVDVGRLEGRAAAWVARTSGPKLVVATQTRVVEVAVDVDGAWVAGVPLIVATAPAARLWLLAAALSAPPVVAWAAARTAGTALTPGSIKLTAALVREVPLPADRHAWGCGAAALQAGDLATFADAMTHAYGCGDDVLDWWRERAKLTWPAGDAVR